MSSFVGLAAALEVLADAAEALADAALAEADALATLAEEPEALAELELAELEQPASTNAASAVIIATATMNLIFLITFPFVCARAFSSESLPHALSFALLY